jgi:N-methylhydantoinase B
VTGVDPTTLAVVRGFLEEVVDEMDLIQVRSAFSVIVSESHDRANGIYQPATGETVAQGRDGSPIFVSAMQHAVQAVARWLDHTGRTWEPGDAYLLNDPYLGGTHLQDAKLVAPFFWDDEPLFLLANTGHWMDVGAAQAGAFGPSCTTIFEEGLRLPPIRFARDGRIDPDLLELVRVNNRLPDTQEGDVRSQLNALVVGQRRLDRLLERYGRQVVLDCVTELDARSERQMGDRIDSIADGIYRASDHFDNDGINPAPLRIELAVTVEGRQMHIDFAGTDPVCDGPMNLARPTTVSACHTGLKHLFPEIPISGGCFRPVTVHTVPGSLVDPSPPHAVGGYADAAARIVCLVGLALVDAVPDDAVAAAFQTGGVAVLSGEHQGAPFVATLPYGGGYGGCRGSDGLVNGTSVVGMARYPSIEVTEQDYPILWDRYGIRQGSGGAGRWRGGCGNEYRFTVESDTILSVLGEQATSGPRGVLGGAAGAVNEVAFTVDGEWRTPDLGAKVNHVRLRAGDQVHLSSPGGGGYGPAAERDPAAVEHDLRLGYEVGDHPDPGITA